MATALGPWTTCLLATFTFLLGAPAEEVPGDVAPSNRSRSQPNIVFLVVESTDGRVWSRDYMNGAVELPNIKKLQDQGMEFQMHYANAPVCCPSRATFWSGRHAHRIPHRQAGSGLEVRGAWNNFEGLPKGFSNRMDQVLGKHGYNVRMSGKKDWASGSHSETVRLAAWTKYADIPYNVSKWPGGWITEDTCTDPGTVEPHNTPDPRGSMWKADWHNVEETTEWIKTSSATDARPFFVYQGMFIVHPTYRTNRYWYDRVDSSKLVAPLWQPVEDMHPCDFQSSMLKGCLPPKESDVGKYFYTEEHKIHIRRIYLAMVAEFDAMVGRYIDAVKATGRFENTVFIVTSDHGDMQMEHRQFYKMTAYDASARVPMVIMDGRSPRQERSIIDAPTQLIDIYPTVLQYAGVARSLWPELDGYALQPLWEDRTQRGRDVETTSDDESQRARPDFVVAQFHGDNIASSWFMIVHNHMKLVVWGTGEQHPHQLFNLTADPDEMKNLVHEESLQSLVEHMLQKLLSVVDYPAIAKDVAAYGLQSMQAWISATPKWKRHLASKDVRWHDSWESNPKRALAAIERWLKESPQVKPCRGPAQELANPDTLPMVLNI